MLTFVQHSQLPQEIEIEREKKIANKLERSKLDKLREELSIPPRELNKIAKEVIGREFGDTRFLSATENRRVRMYLKRNGDELGKRYRKLMWTA